MNQTERLAATLHAKTPGFRRKVEASTMIVEDALQRSGNPYVAFSAGKDSDVVLHLVRTVSPAAVAVWSDDEWNLPETIERVANVENLHKIAAKVQHAEWFTSWDGERRPDPDTVWVDAPANNGLQTFAKLNKYDGVFIGLRAEENARRKMHLRTHGFCFWAKGDGLWQCNPIAWWSVMDVWAYITLHGIPYNTAYDRLSALGVPLEQQRIGPFAVERVLGYGQLSLLKRGWPELFNQFAAKYPEARSYV